MKRTSTDRSKKISELKLNLISIILVICILIPNVALAIKFNEIMYNPEGSDSGREWIEIYDENCNATSIEEYQLFESGTNHAIIKFNNITMCKYAILCNGCANLLLEYNVSNTPLYQSSFSLLNSGEYLELKKAGTMIDEINYSAFISPSEGYSAVFINGTWTACDNKYGSPGADNFLIDNIQTNQTGNFSYNQTMNESMNATSNITTNVTINVTINITMNLTINVTTNSTINITNETSNNSSNTSSNRELCNLSIYIDIKNNISLIKSGTQIKFRNRIMMDNVTFKGTYFIEYWIEDLFGNIVKNKIITKNDDEKSYTPDIDEKDKIMLIKNKLVNASCIIGNGNIAESSSMIIITNQNYSELINCPKPGGSTKTTSSSSSTSNSGCYCPISLQSSQDESTIANLSRASNISVVDIISEDGGIIVNLKIFKGDTRKSLIKIYIENNNRRISNFQEIKLMNKYTNVETVLYLPITKEYKNSDCNKTYLLIEGIDVNISKPIDICMNTNSLTTNSSTTHISNQLSAQQYIVENQSSYNNMMGDKIFDASQNQASLAENNSYKKFLHNDTGLITGYSAYESPNRKNRIYALAGILILAMAGIVFLIYRMRLNVSDRFIKKD